MHDEIVKLAQRAIQMASNLLKAKQPAAALSYCQQLLKVQPDNAEAWLLAGISHACLHDKTAALIAIDYAITHATDENQPFAKHIKASILNNGLLQDTRIDSDGD